MSTLRRYMRLYAILRGDDGVARCACGTENCRAIGKHPDPYDRGPDDGHGVETGNGLLVLDIDNKPGRPNGFLSLQGKPLPDTYVVRTPTGGAHLYYRYDPSSVTVGCKVGILPGVDVRADGGFVVGPGSPHANGGRYEELGGTMVDAPAWLLEAAKKTPVEWTAPTPLSETDPRYPENVRRCIEELQQFPPAKEGERDHTFFIAAQVPVRKYLLPQEVSERLLTEVYNPRCLPPFDDIECARVVHRKVEEAASRGTKDLGTAKEDWIQNLITREPPSIRKNPNAEHIYSFEMGSPASPQRIPLCTSDIANRLLIDEAWEGVWQYDEFRDRILAVDPPMRLDAETRGLTDADSAVILNWFEHNGTKTAKETCYTAAVLAARRNSFHPVKEYLQKLPAPTTSYLDNLAERVLGNSSPIAQTFVKLTLIAAVRRILHPGCQMDSVLTLYGGQGIGKTSFCRILFGDFYRSQMPDLGSRDASAALKGYWGIELAELDRVLRAESSTVKEFLTRTTDDYRGAYERGEAHVPRQCIFIGTTNTQDFLRDEERRYWPLETYKVDLAWLKEHRDAVWSEAYALAKSDISHHLTGEEVDLATEVRDDYLMVDPWEDPVRDYCAGKEWIKSTAEIFQFKLGGNIDHMTKREENRIGSILRTIGYERIQRREGDRRVKRWKLM